MNTDLITVVTATFGNSCSHLNRVLQEERKFTKLPFTQIVSDDGTISEDTKRRQREVVYQYPDCHWTENPGPTYGVSYNLNWVCEQVKTPWAFVVEDSVRTGQGWLETAMDALEKVGLRKWHGHEVGAIGMASSFENWHLASAGVLQSCALGDCFGKHDERTYASFWSGGEYPNWNDGLWCWQRMLPHAHRICSTSEGDHWPEIIRRTWRDPILRGEIGNCLWGPDQITREECWTARGGWPSTRGVTWSYGASAWCLINMKAWREVGRWRDGCTFYEGHLGLRMNLAGYLTLNVECPPWLHYPSLAFRAMERGEGKHPRHHEPCDGPGGILERDFGVNGEEHVGLAQMAVQKFGQDKVNAINEELKAVRVYADPAWEKYA
jgi:hypothetical protein